MEVIQTDKQQGLWSKANVATGIILFTFVGFFMSRAMLSLGVFLLGINALRDVHPKRWLQQKWWLLGCVWLLFYAVSWFWSEDKQEWNMHLQVKLPFLIWPLAFAFMPRFTQRQLQFLTLALATLYLSGIGYSLSFLISNPELVKEGYNFSKMLPTPVYEDHINFSASIVMFLIWTCSFWNRLQGSKAKYFMGFSLVAFVLYLHILSAKTGLLMLYIFVLCGVLYILFSKKIKLGIILVAALFTGVFAAYKSIDTFRIRIDYTLRTLEEYNKGNFNGDYSDNGRIISYDIAMRIIKDHLLSGVGAGDMNGEMAKGYKQWYPQIPQEQYLAPHNQFIIITMVVGLPGLFFFLYWLIRGVPRYNRGRAWFFLFCTWICSVVPLMVNPALEIQFGVFLFLFFFLWQRHAYYSEAPKAA